MATIQVVIASSTRSWSDNAAPQLQGNADQLRGHDRRFHLEPLCCCLAVPNPDPALLSHLSIRRTERPSEQ